MSSMFGTGNSIVVTTANAKALGLIANNTAVDGAIGFNANLNWSLDPNTTPSGIEHGLIAAAEHEISEVMGRNASVGAKGLFMPIDFFRYAYGAGGQPERDLTPGVSGSNATAFFSIDNGNTNLGTWNNDPKRGDPGDWKAGHGSAPQGGDSFGPAPAGFVDRLTMNDVTLMNVIGWTTNDLPSPLNSGLTIVTNGLTDWVHGGQQANFVYVTSGGYQEIGNGGAANDTTLDPGGTQDVYAGGTPTCNSAAARRSSTRAPPSSGPPSPAARRSCKTAATPTTPAYTAAGPRKSRLAALPTARSSMAAPRSSAECRCRSSPKPSPPTRRS
jgi:autotransporter passenger strand-loop-strand repeat protein